MVPIALPAHSMLAMRYRGLRHSKGRVCSYLFSQPRLRGFLFLFAGSGILLYLAFLSPLVREIFPWQDGKGTS
jgi:hypothetical protein